MKEERELEAGEGGQEEPEKQEQEGGEKNVTEAMCSPESLIAFPPGIYRNICQPQGRQQKEQADGEN